MDIEEAFKQVGEIGVYQRRVFWSTAIPQIFVAWFHLLNIYAGAIPDFYCYLEKPTEENEIKLLNKCSPDPVGNPCISYSFSDVEFTSIASEWDLVCDSAYKCDLVQSIFMIGLLIGNLLGGYTADKYGRKPACCIGSFGFLIFGLLSTFATSYNQYLSLRLINGVASGIYGLISFTYPAEMVGASYRGYVNFVTSVTFAIGISTLPILAYFVRDWRMLSLYCALPGLFGIYYYYCVIESPRWLYSQNRIAEAEHVMNVMYQANQPLSLPPPPPLTLSMTSITASLRYVFVYVCEYVHVSTFSRVPTSLPASPSSENLRTLLQEAVMEHAAVNNKNKNITNHTNNKNSNSFSNGSNSANNFSNNNNNNFGNNNNNNFSNNNNNFSSTDDDEELNRNDIEIQESLLYKENTSIAGLFDGIVHTYEEIHNQNKTHHDVSNINSNININNKNINNNNVINNNNSILYKKYKSRSHRIVLRHNKGHGKFSNGKVAVSSTKWSDVISSKFLLKITAVNMLAWLTANTLYYGLTLKMGDLNGNRYVNVMFSGLVEIPACLFTLYFMDTYGRKTTFTYTLLSCGFLTLLMGLTSPGTSYVSVGLALMSKTIVAMGVCVCWMHATEMYPTNIRNKAMSLCSMCGRFGGVVAPMILSLGRVTEGRDFIIFGLASIISGIFSLHLPETLHRKLPETIDDLTFMVN